MSIVSWINDTYDRITTKYDEVIVAGFTVLLTISALAFIVLCGYALIYFLLSWVSPDPRPQPTAPKPLVAIQAPQLPHTPDQITVESWTQGKQADFTVLIDQRAGTRILYIQSHYNSIPAAVPLLPLPVQLKSSLPESMP